MISVSTFKPHTHKQVEDKSGTWCGVMLLLLFLFFDSFTSQWQSRMFSKHEVSQSVRR